MFKNIYFYTLVIFIFSYEVCAGSVSQQITTRINRINRLHLEPQSLKFVDINFFDGCSDNRNRSNTIGFKLANAASGSTLSGVYEIKVNYVTRAGLIKRAFIARRGVGGLPISDEYIGQRLSPRPIDTVHITLVAKDRDGNVIANTQQQIESAPEIENIIFVEGRRIGETGYLPASWTNASGLRDRNGRRRGPIWIVPVRMKNLKNPVLVPSGGGSWPRYLPTPKIETERTTDNFAEIEGSVPNDLKRYFITFPLDRNDTPGFEVTELSVTLEHNNPFSRCIDNSSVSGSILQTAPVVVR